MPYAQRKWKARKPGPRFGIGDSRGLAARRPIAVRREAMDGADVVIIPGMVAEVGGFFFELAHKHNRGIFGGRKLVSRGPH